MGTWRAALGRLMVVLVAVMVGGALAEGVVRLAGLDNRMISRVLYYQRHAPALHRVSPDPFLHFELQPGAVESGTGPWNNAYRCTINEHGARGPAHAPARGAGVFRVLCFGASTMFGTGVDDGETIAAKLEDYLNIWINYAAEQGAVSPNTRIEVWNFGVSAYVLSQKARLARREIARHPPDLVVVQLSNRGRRAFLGAEEGTGVVTDYLPYFRADPSLYPENFLPPDGRSSRLHFFGLRHSGLYRYVAAWERRHGEEHLSPYGDAMSRLEAEALSREAEAAGIPVVYFPVPGTAGFRTPQQVFAGLKPDRFIDLYLPDQEADYYNFHPPPWILARWSAKIAEILIERGLVPGGAASRAGGTTGAMRAAISR